MDNNGTYFSTIGWSLGSSPPSRGAPRLGFGGAIWSSPGQMAGESTSHVGTEATSSWYMPKMGVPPHPVSIGIFYYKPSS